MKITHCMCDLETWGTKPGCAIRSIGACLFTLEGDIGALFYCNIDEQSCLDIGLTKDAGTVAWWGKQSREAQEALLVSPVPLGVAIENFLAWYRLNGAKRLWCQGANFDAPILEYIIERLGTPIPWAYWDVRDTRTVYDICGFNAKAKKRSGTYHNALDDCLHQIACIHSSLACRPEFHEMRISGIHSLLADDELKKRESVYVGSIIEIDPLTEVPDEC